MTKKAQVVRAFGGYRHGQMHYRISRPEAPSHPPLLCLHMSPSSGRIYRRLLAEIGQDRIGIAPDTPGFGETDLPPAPLEIADFAEANFGLIEQLGIDAPIDVMGYHTGSLTAVEMARQRPQRVRRLVIVSAAIFTPEELEEFRAHYGPQEITEDGAHLLRLWKAIRHWRDTHQSLELSMEHFAEHLRGGVNAWWGHRAAFNYDLGGVLPGIEQPILVLNPEDDLHEHTLRSGPLLKNGHIHELPGWSHGFIEIYPEAVASILRGFLDTG